jgi:hypothetical protein
MTTTFLWIGSDAALFTASSLQQKRVKLNKYGRLGKLAYDNSKAFDGVCQEM